MERGESVESIVAQIMTDFARSTGLSPVNNDPTRYLWTDAFGVCNFLGLYEETKDARYKELALGLVEQTHRVLGRHREDDRRTGWISGLGDQGGRRATRPGGACGSARSSRSADRESPSTSDWSGIVTVSTTTT